MANPLTPKILVTLQRTIKRGEKVTPEEVSKQFGLNPKIAQWAIRLAGGNK